MMCRGSTSLLAGFKVLEVRLRPEAEMPRDVRFRLDARLLEERSRSVTLTLSLR